MSYETLQKAVNTASSRVDEKKVRELARDEGLTVDKKLRVTDFEGEIDTAIQELMFHEFYLEAIRTVMDNIGRFFGYDSAITYARKAPLKIDSDGDLTGFYGDGYDTLDILIDILEKDLGEKVIQNRIRSSMRNSFDEEKWGLLPERIRPVSDDEESTGLLGRFF